MNLGDVHIQPLCLMTAKIDSLQILVKGQMTLQEDFDTPPNIPSYTTLILNDISIQGQNPPLKARYQAGENRAM